MEFLRSLLRRSFLLGNQDWRRQISAIYSGLGPLHMSPVDRTNPVIAANFALGSYEEFQPGFRAEKRPKILGTSSGVKFEKQTKHGETQQL